MSERACAALAYLPGLFIFGIIKDKAAYHVNQGLLLLGFGVMAVCCANIIAFFLALIPAAGWLLALLIRLAAYIFWAALAMLGMSRALSGKEAPLPFIGSATIYRS